MEKIILSKGEIVIYNNHLRIVDKKDDTYVYFRDEKANQINKANIEFVSKISKFQMREYIKDFSFDSEFYSLIPLLTKDEENIIIDLVLK